MPDGSQKKISELPVAPAAHPTDLLETSQADGTGYVSRSITLAQVAAGVVAPPPAWTDITGKPATFPPTVPIAYTDISGKPSTFPPDPEAIDDRVAALLVAGTNITLAYNDPANTLTINSTASGGGSATLPAGSVGYGAVGNTLTGVLADFSWDSTNKRLGIGTAAPAYKFHVAVPTGDIFTVDNSGITSSAGGVNAVAAAALLAGGDWWFGYHLGSGSGGYLGLFGGTGAPTLSTFGKFGSLYLNASTPGLPWYNNNGTTGWDRLVGETSTQTLTNKSLTSPTITGTPSITGYLPLAGGTLTGPLIGTTATMSGDITGGNVTGSSFFAAPGGGMFNSGTTSGVLVGGGQAYNQGAAYVAYSNAAGNKHDWVLNGFVTKMTLDTNGLALSTPLTGTTATFSGTVSAPGTQIQMVSTQTGAVATGSTVIPNDDTIPQITEGDQYMTLVITPKSATSRLIIEANVVVGSSVANFMSAALFQDATANALAACCSPLASASTTTISLRHTMISGTTSATTFRIRAGSASAGTTTFNGNASVRMFGGVMASSIVIREVA